MIWPYNIVATKCGLQAKEISMLHKNHSWYDSLLVDS